MSEASAPTKACPFCGEQIRAEAQKCRYCQEWLDPKMRANEELPEGIDRYLTAAGRPASAIAAGYLGLFSLLPFFGIAAIIVSIVALRKLKAEPYLLGKGRAIFGLVMGIIFTCIYALPMGVLLMQAMGLLPTR